MTDENPIKTDARRRRRQEKFGNPNPKCVLCGCPDLESFTPVSHGWLKAHGIELHHIVGEQRDPNLIAPLCLNCHRTATEGLARAGVDMAREPDPRQRIASMLEALAEFLVLVVDALRRWATTLKESLEGESQDV
jgi:hypothetical protein